MGVLSSILDAFKSIFKKVVHFVVEFVRQYWMVIVAIAVIYFAPALLLWATTAGAPAWLIAGLQGLTALTPYLTAALETGLAAYEWAVGAWEALGIWYQLAFTAGAMFVLAPEEMKEAAREISEEVTKGGAALASAVGSAAAAVAGGVASGLGSAVVKSDLFTLAAGGLCLWWFLAWRRKKKREDEAEAIAGESDRSGLSGSPENVAFSPGFKATSFGPSFASEANRP